MGLKKNPLHHPPLCASSTLRASSFSRLEAIMQISIKLKKFSVGHTCTNTYLTTVLLVCFSSCQQQIWQRPALSRDVWPCCFGIVLKLKGQHGLQIWAQSHTKYSCNSESYHSTSRATLPRCPSTSPVLHKYLGSERHKISAAAPLRALQRWSIAEQLCLRRPFKHPDCSWWE